MRKTHAIPEPAGGFWGGSDTAALMQTNTDGQKWNWPV